MNYTPPATITFHSDSNVLQFTRTVRGKKITTYVYTYVKSSTKIGSELVLNEEDIKALIRKEIIVTA